VNKTTTYILNLFFILFFSVSNAERTGNDPIKEKKLLELIVSVVKRTHFDPEKINDDFSIGVFKTYMNRLDPNKRLFLVSDIKEFKEFETKIDNQIKDKDVSFFNITYYRTLQRMQEAKNIYTELCKNTIDFTLDETFNVDYSRNGFAQTKEELKNVWRLQIKYGVLQILTDKILNEVAQREENPKYNSKTFLELEKESRMQMLRTLDNSDNNPDFLYREKFFNLFANAIVTQFDSHSYYYDTIEKLSHDALISGKIVTTGIILKLKKDSFEISEIVQGSSAERSKKIDIGDVVQKIAIGNGKFISISELDINQVNKLLNNEIGTNLKIVVKKTNGSIKTVPLKIDLIEIYSTTVQSSVVEKNGKRFGIINLPSFYTDFDNAKSKDAAKDVAIEIENLKKSNVEGIVFDVRNNGGGAVKTAVEITGMFIEKGPVVQIKSNEEKKELLSDMNQEVKWDGPLVVLIDNNSASATEIFAAAIQDYRRGIIMGTKQSFGKGTMQNTIDLDKFNPKGAVGNYGSLKTTFKKYYRINGGSTQLKGISSDIYLPHKDNYLNLGERNEEKTLPWDEISSVKFKPVNKKDFFDDVIKKSIKRVEDNKNFKLIEEYSNWMSSRKEKRIISLNVDKFKFDYDKSEVELVRFVPTVNYKNNLNFNSTLQDLEIEKKDKNLSDKRKEWHIELSSDIYVEEAINVLNDMKPNENLIAKSK
jgi:carboxyl-terminal processing protease